MLLCGSNYLKADVFAAPQLGKTLSPVTGVFRCPTIFLNRIHVMRASAVTQFEK